MVSKILELPAERAVEALCAAFLVDDEFQETFWLEDRMDVPRSHSFFGAQVASSEVFGAPALGVAPEAATEAAITYYALHHGLAWNPVVTFRFVQAMWSYYRGVPPPVRSRVDRYTKWIHANLPKAPHFFITALGVPKPFRGRGHAATLIAEVVRRSRADVKSNGVAISTFSRTRADLYERHGFRQISHGAQDGMEAWVLYLDHGNTT